MSTPTLSHVFASLSLLTWAATLLTIVLAIVRQARPDSGAAALFDDLGGLALWLAWIVAAVTMGGSLYYSQVANFVPCELCWAQRICLYPFAIVLLVAALRRDRKVWTYVVPVAVIGAAIAAYHVQLQAYPAQQSFCSTLVPCTTRYVWEFGFVSLPFMSLAASTFIITMVLVARATDPDRNEDADESSSGESTPERPGSNLTDSPSVDVPPDQVGAV
jgi:disulfide bond formation protein DsbB